MTKPNKYPLKAKITLSKVLPPEYIRENTAGIHGLLFGLVNRSFEYESFLSALFEDATGIPENTAHIDEQIGKYHIANFGRDITDEQLKALDSYYKEISGIHILEPDIQIKSFELFYEKITRIPVKIS